MRRVTDVEYVTLRGARWLVSWAMGVESMTLVSGCGASTDFLFSTDWLGRSGAWEVGGKITFLWSWFIGVFVEVPSLDATDKYPMLAEWHIAVFFQ